jgi:steroid delta-isomerase-like uncharacterized protein
MKIRTALSLRIGLALLLSFIGLQASDSALSARARWPVETEKNKALVQRWIEEGFNKRNPNVVDEIFVETFAINGREMRREDLKQSMRRRLAAFPDLQVTIDECIGDGAQVGIWYTAHGTHQGAFEGIAPTGRQVTWVGVDLFHLEGGKIAQGRFVDDALGLMKQLGARLELPAAQVPD